MGPLNKRIRAVHSLKYLFNAYLKQGMVLGHLDRMTLTVFSLGGEFRCTYKNNHNMKQSLSFIKVEPRCCCDTSVNGTQLFQLISGDLALVRFEWL